MEILYFDFAPKIARMTVRNTEITDKMRIYFSGPRERLPVVILRYNRSCAKYIKSKPRNNPVNNR